jgi:hypothetical protein
LSLWIKKSPTRLAATPIAVQPQPQLCCHNWNSGHRHASPPPRPSKRDHASMETVRRSAAIILLVATVLASLHVGKVTGAYDEWQYLLIRLLDSQQLRSASRNLVTPNSGEEVLPPLVREMLALLRKHDIFEYAISPEISAGGVLPQRLIESAFPKRMMPTAHYLLALAEEPLPPTCRRLDAEGGVEVAACD